MSRDSRLTTHGTAFSRALPLVSPRTPPPVPEAASGCHRIRPSTSGRDRRGFTIIEMLAVIAIVGVLSSVGYARISFVLEHAKVARAIGDLVTISQELAAMDTLPGSLAAIKRGDLLDPWGRAYVYYPFPTGSAPPGDARQDRFLVPINSRFDLYSLGPDGQSMPPLTADLSRDDIVVAADGGFTGRALEY